MRSTSWRQWRNLLMVVAAVGMPLLSTPELGGVGLVVATSTDGTGIIGVPESVTRESGVDTSSIATTQSEALSTDTSIHMLVASNDDTTASDSASPSDSTTSDIVVTPSSSSSASSAASASSSASSAASSSASSSASSTSGSSSSASSESPDPTDSSGSYYNATVGYDCTCSDARKVSLLGASDYCLAPGARYSAKCGNRMLGELGECPRTGAQPCSGLGHVLTEDSVCGLDEKDDVYKCTASEDDQDIHSGKKRSKKKKSSSSDGGLEEVGNGARASTGGSLSSRALTVAAVFLVGGFGGVVF